MMFIRHVRMFDSDIEAEGFLEKPKNPLLSLFNVPLFNPRRFNANIKGYKSTMDFIFLFSIKDYLIYYLLH